MSFGSLFEGLIVGGEDFYGKRVVVPEFQQTDAAKEQRLAIQGNKMAFKKGKKLARRINVFNQAELRKMLTKGISQFKAMMEAGSQRSLDLLNNQSFADMLKGKIPQDVQDMLRNTAAGQAYEGGYAGAGLESGTQRSYLEARDIARTSLDLISKGSALTTNAVNSAEKWLASSKQLAVPGQYDVTTMFIGPKERIANSQLNNANQWMRDKYAAEVAAAPDPAKRGAFDSEMSILGMALSAYSGGAGYTNTYKPPTGGGASSGANANDYSQTPSYLQNPGFNFSNSGY